MSDFFIFLIFYAKPLTGLLLSGKCISYLFAKMIFVILFAALSKYLRLCLCYVEIILKQEPVFILLFRPILSGRIVCRFFLQNQAAEKLD